MKKISLFLKYVILLWSLFLSEICFAQEDFNVDNNNMSSYYTMKFLEQSISQKGIDTTNKTQIVDSLSSDNRYLRDLLIEYCGESKIIAAIPKLHVIHDSASFANDQGTKTLVLTSLIAFDDSTIFVSLKNGIDSLPLPKYAEQIALYAGYLKKKIGQDYNWIKVISAYSKDNTYTMPDMNILLNFLGIHATEIETKLIDIAQNCQDPFCRKRAISVLAKTEYADKEQLIYQLSILDTSEDVRNGARWQLEKLGSRFYASSLYAALNAATDTVTRKSLIWEIKSTCSPHGYEHLFDLYNTTSENEKTFINLCMRNGDYWGYLDVKRELDTLYSAVEYFASLGWVGDSNYKTELKGYINEALSLYAQNDTLGVVRALRKFLGRVDSEVSDSTNQTPSYITDIGWEYLYKKAAFTLKEYTGSNYEMKLYSCTPSELLKGSPDTRVSIYGRLFNSTVIFQFNDVGLPISELTDSTFIVTIPKEQMFVAKNTELFLYDEVTFSCDSLSFKIQSIGIRLLPSMTLPNSNGFSLEVTGKGFTSASKVLWNDSVRTTTFIADSLLSANILASDVATVGEKIVRVKYDSTSSAVSDSMVFSVVTTLPKPVRLVIEKEIDNHNGTMTAWFGYLNVNDRSVYIPVGDKNSFTPTPIDRGQATIFLPGRHKYVFGVTFPNTINIEWQLNGRRAKAGSVCEN